MLPLPHWHLLFTFALQHLFHHALPTLANTEIVNFAAGSTIPVPPVPRQNWCGHSFPNPTLVTNRGPTCHFQDRPSRGSERNHRAR